MSITFKYHVPLADTMGFEGIYPEELRMRLDEKDDLRRAPGSVFVWLFVDHQLVGEAYGVPLESMDEGIQGLENIHHGFYCYSNTIMPEFQRRGYGVLLKAHWLGIVAARGANVVYGHARPGGSQKLNANFGAEFIGDFVDWYGTNETYKLYRLNIDAL